VDIIGENDKERPHSQRVDGIVDW